MLTLRLGNKITALALIAALAPVMTLLVLIRMVDGSSHERVTTALSESIAQTHRSSVRALWNLCALYYQSNPQMPLSIEQLYAGLIPTSFTDAPTYLWISPFAPEGSDLEGLIVMPTQTHAEPFHRYAKTRPELAGVRQQVMERAIDLGDGEVDSIRVPQGLLGGDDPAQGITMYFTYFEPWNLMIGITAYDDDYKQVHEQVGSIFDELYLSVVLSALAIFILVAILAMLAGRHIAQPIRNLTEIARQVAYGHLERARTLAERVIRRGDDLTGDESGELTTVMVQMIDDLSDLVLQLQRASSRLGEATEALQSRSAEQRAAAEYLSEGSGAIAAATSRIVTGVTALDSTIVDLSGDVHSTALLARDGSAALEQMQAGVANMNTATEAVVAKLAAITERTGNIRHIGEMIGAIAEQTNILSLNAAIEAEKAGVSGQGFSVVAREIRRLADQTALAALEIGQMVGMVHQSISEGSAEIAVFEGIVRRGVSHSDHVRSQMSGILEQVQAGSQRFCAIEEGIRAQVEAADQIHAAIGDLHSAASRTELSMAAFAEQAGALRRTVEKLEQTVARFNVPSAAALVGAAPDGTAANAAAVNAPAPAPDAPATAAPASNDKPDQPS